MKFQNIHISCWHAITAIHELKYVINDFIHEVYFITSYKAIYKTSFTFIDIENLSDDSDCKTYNIKTHQGCISKKQKHANQSQSSK